MCRKIDRMSVPFILAGMKDRKGDTTQVPYIEGGKMATNINASYFIECSALTGVSHIIRML